MQFTDASSSVLWGELQVPFLGALAWDVGRVAARCDVCVCVCARCELVLVLLKGLSLLRVGVFKLVFE